MKAALIGASYSGKSTVFTVLTGVESGKKEETMGSIKAPDERIDKLAEIYSPKKTTFAEFILSDFSLQSTGKEIIPVKVKNLIQKTDLLIILLRNFSSNISGEAPEPESEYSKIKEEILMSDYMIIEKRIEREQKEKKNPPEIPVLKKLMNSLESSVFPKDDDLTDEEMSLISNYNLLSLKNRIVLINQEEGNIEMPSGLKDLLDKENITYFDISATLEKELTELPEEERADFLESFNIKETARERFIQHAYSALGLISFFTTGEDEVRAWPLKKGSSAVEAAGKIHSDISRGFIRAETVAYETFMKYKSDAECKKAGVYRLEGKEYIVADGDIINFRFNV